MATRKDSLVLGQLRALMTVGSIGDLTDGQLLERFATGQGEAAELAFAALVERHGPMVWRVCRGVLADPHDTQDAFQATFLVLVKKARGLWVKDSLGAWLHQVAWRTASSALKEEFRRRRHERRAAELAAATAGGDEEGAGSDVERLLHAEIDRLPERYRVPIVLCELEGRSHEQAARHLGWPIGTVKSRLSRGRDRLRDRLRRRGLFAGLEPIAAAFRLGGLDDVIPAALVRSTTAAAVRFSASRTIRSAAVAALAQGALNTMSATRWIKVASVLLVACATVSGIGLVPRMAASGDEPATQKKALSNPRPLMPVAEARNGKFKFSVVAPGSIETAGRMDVLCEIKGLPTIISIVPEGTKVKKGDLVCMLDSASLRDQLINQKITTRAAEANYQNAKLARELAELAVKEYKEGTYTLEKATILGEIKLAESAIQKAKDELERTRRAYRRLNDTRSRPGAATGSSDVLAELDLENRLASIEQTLMREQFSLEKALGQRNLLVNYTKDKMIRDLSGKVEERKSVELAKEAILDLERDKESMLERQIANCKLIAPGDGVVEHYVTALSPPIKEGATVHERQVIFSIIDLGGPWQVNARAPEATVDKLGVGQKVRIEVDAFSDATFSGEVIDVAPRPDPLRSGSPVRVYPTRIRIDGIARGLRPGMSARVEILVSEHGNALLVPVETIVQYAGKDHVAVKQPDGDFAWRDVILGQSNDAEVEVKQGLKPGEHVALDPSHLLTEEERSKAHWFPPASKKESGAGRAKGKASGKAARK